MKRIFILTIGLIAMLWIAVSCGNDPPPIEGTDGDYDEYIIDGGGTTGGPIDGRLVIWFIDAASGDPIPGTLVQVGNDADTALTETADDNGRVVFADRSLEGPVDFHYMASGYTPSSVYGLNAKYITIEVYNETYEPDEPDLIDISGTVTGMDLLPEPGTLAEVRFAMIGQGLPLADIYTDEYEEPEQSKKDDSPSNMIIEGIQDSFTLTAHNRKGTLFALAGLVTFLGKDEVDMEFTHIGYILGFDPETDDTKDVEIPIEDALDETIRVEVTPMPDEYDVANGILIVDLGDDGTLSFAGFGAAGTNDLDISVPDLTAAPYDGKDTKMLFAAGPEDESEYPTGLRQVHDVMGKLSGESTLVIDDLLPPPRDLTWNGEKLAYTLTGDANFASFDFEHEDGTGLWSVTIAHPDSGDLVQPTLPTGWGFEGVPESGLLIEAESFQIDADPNEIAFKEMFGVVISFAGNVLEVP